MPSPASDLEISLLAPGDAIDAFTCGDSDLDDFLRNDAERLQGCRAVQTYLARRVDTGAEVLGFVSLLTDAVKLKAPERKRLNLLSSDHPVVPAVKIARLGVCSHMQRGNGIGTALVRFALFRAHDVAGIAACRLLTLDAYPAALAFYEGLGFKKNTEAEYKDRTRPSMRLDLFGTSTLRWLSPDPGP